MIQIKFADRLRKLREAAGLRKCDLARMIHVSPPAISQWESDWCRPSYDTLAILAEIFHTTTYYGSSVYDTAQMARLIDRLMFECDIVGIDTTDLKTKALLEVQDGQL